MATRNIGGVPYTIHDYENYLGVQFVTAADIPPPAMASLGAPENPTTYALCAGVLWRYKDGNWVRFYAPGEPGAPGADGPPNTLSVGSVTTLAAGSSATAEIIGDSPNQTLSLGIPRGGNGTAGTNGTNGAANSLSIGSVTALAAGASPTATITGTAPSQTLSLGIPAGANGSNGNNGPANSLSVGTVTALAAGATPTATITGAAPSQTLSLGIPVGAAGTAGTNGTNGTNGVGVSPGAPAAMAVAFATAYQVADPSKAAHINIMLESNYVTTLAGTSADELEVRIGSTNAVATGGGSQVATWKTSLTGIALTIGLGIIQRNPVAFMLPPGWYFSVRRLSGTTATIVSTVAQPLG